MYPKRLWEEIGGFDEEYALYGEDSDFCKELLKRGYKLAIRSDVFVFHHGHSSTPIAEARGKDIPALVKASRQRYKEKWSPNRVEAKKDERAPARKCALARKRHQVTRTQKSEAARIREEKENRKRRFLQWKRDKAEE